MNYSFAGIGELIRYPADHPLNGANAIIRKVTE